MMAEQKRVYQEIGGARGGLVRGPFVIWLRNPEIADLANQFGNSLRLRGKLDKRLFELMVLIVARHWSAQYEWFAHEKAALKAGVRRGGCDSRAAGAEVCARRRTLGL
jgi:4-carboxymuconolactone decarboxylase